MKFLFTILSILIVGCGEAKLEITSTNTVDSVVEEEKMHGGSPVPET